MAADGGNFSNLMLLEANAQENHMLSDASRRKRLPGALWPRSEIGLQDFCCGFVCVVTWT